MANWRLTVDLGNLLSADAGLTLEERADGIHKVFAASGLYKPWNGAGLLSRVEQLKEYAKTGDPDVFDVALGRIYDWCDAELVWLETHRFPKKGEVSP